MGAGARHEKSFRLQQLQTKEISSNREIRATHRSTGHEGLTSVGVQS
jgi:hypothetical protein